MTTRQRAAILAFLFLSFCLGELDSLAQTTGYKPGPMLSKMLDGPMKGVDEIVFCVRVPGRDHWYVTFGYYSCDYGPGAERAYGPYPDGKTLRGYDFGGRLCRYNLKTGELKVILDDAKGGVRDPQMHYDGKKVLFSYRKGESPTFHLYEINIDGTGLTQLTSGQDDDIEPCYLPDGDIMFCSSRCRRFVNCWYTRVATLYRCDGDGSNIRLISSNNDHDNTPWVLPDGRILYMRWEYVDRSQVHFHHLWTVNPDGTGQMTYFGNEFAGTAMLDAKPIPGSEKIVASFSPGHGRHEHYGHVTVVDPKNGPDDLSMARNISKRSSWKDPYALSEECFLAVNPRGIHVMDGAGQTELVYSLPDTERSRFECHEPRPLRARPREKTVAPRIDLEQPTGTLVLGDIYDGRNMKGVKRGDIKKLLVLEQLPMPVHFSGGMESISIGGSFTLARILGTVPVEADGSANFDAPASRSLFFVALDENDEAVKRMQSFVTLQPGEVAGCVGCHEKRTHTAAPTPMLQLRALTRDPDKIQPIPELPTSADGTPMALDFHRDIQPILDRNCVECHNPDRREGKIDLCGDHTMQFCVSYWTIRNHNLVADGRNQAYGNREPRSIGSAASRLLDYADGGHHDVKLTETEKVRLRLWVESSGTYAGTYASLGCGVYHLNLPGHVLQQRCASCHAKGKPWPEVLHRLNYRPRCNLDRPEKSLLLMAPLAKSAGGEGACGDVFADTSAPGYQQMLKAIQNAGNRLQEGKRFDMEGFRPNKHWIREMQRWGFLPAELKPEDPIDYYEVEQAYFKSFWYTPK